MTSATEPDSPPVRFAGKVAIITGSSDRGIGGETALRLASEGAAVALLARHEPTKLLKRLAKQNRRFTFMLGDVTVGNDLDALVAGCLKDFGRLDVLVNNAGIEIAKPLVDFAEVEWRQMLDINLNGAIALSQRAIPHLASPGGVIVNVASALALGGCTGFAIYSASKAAMVGFTQSLAWELAPRGVRVVAVAPGLVHTAMVHRHVQNLTPEVWQQVEAAHPLGMGRPDDVSSAIAFLASPEARWITGVTLPLGWAYNYQLPSHAMLG